MVSASAKSRIRRAKARVPACLYVTALLFLVSGIAAKERVEKVFDETSGLTVSTVYALAQDDRGFLWIGTTGGLVRFDGMEMRSWATESFARVITSLLCGPGGEVLVLDEGHAISQVGSEGVRPLAGPDGKPLTNIISAAFSGDRNRLWVAGGDFLIYRDADNRWGSVDMGPIAGQHIRRVKPGTGDSVFLLTNKGILQIDSAAHVRKISEIASASDIIHHPGGSFYVLSWPSRGEVVELRDGKASLRLSIKARPIDLELRGDVIWASFDRYLVAFRPGEPPEILDAEDGIPSGGPLLVDREGSFWMGTFRGLIQYPEPETIAFNDRDGLPSAHTRFLAKTEQGIWVSTWQGLGRLERTQRGWKARNERLNHIGPFCLDGGDNLWVHVFDGDTLRHSRGRFVRLPLPRFRHLACCASGVGGTMWLATEQGLLRADESGQSRFIAIPPDLPEARTVFLDRQRRLWVSARERICSTDVSAVDSGQPEWSCDSLEGVQIVTDMIRLPGGSLWAATHNAGVWRFRDGRWEPIPGSNALASGRIWGMAPSSSGGVWVLGDGVYVRVIERADLPEGWEAVERLSTWQGLLAGEAEDLIEEPDGGLWIATIGGVVYMPPEARRVTPLPPPVELVNILLNGQRAPLGESMEVPAGRNQVELRFAALSYRDRNLLRYQYRLHPRDPWTDSASSVPQFRFVNLSPGQYVVEIRASLDGVQWSARHARFSFEVLSPWYTRWWFLTLSGSLVAAALYLAYRIRLAFLLRLERQRTRIAMDLHDELGSGLGSIGILSNIVSDGRLDEAERRSLASKIAETSRELGAALTDIVWALAPASNDLESLAYHLTEHGERLFAGDQVRFSTDFPQAWPRVSLSLAARRNLQLIALEAMHNAARHAAASRVVLGLKPVGRRWRMWIADDGLGMGETSTTATRGGMGLNSMKRRAEEIRAEIAWSADNGRGTLVMVTFLPRSQK